MLQSNPMTSRAGTFWLEIQTNANSPNANFEIKQLGDITYEFDLVPTDTRGGYVGGIPGSLTVTIWDKMSNTGSAYDSLENDIGNYSLLDFVTTPVADATMYLLPAGETNAANAYDFPFSLRFGDISLDERSHDTTLKFSPRKLTLNVGTWEQQYGNTGFPERVPILYVEGENLPPPIYIGFASYACGDVITNVLSGMNPSGTLIFETAHLSQSNTGENTFAFPTRDMLAEQSNYVSNAFPEAGVIAPLFFAGTQNVDPTWTVGHDNIIYDKVATFAGMEGAIFGTAFGYNFYINRNNNTYNVAISNVEIEKLGFQANPRDINSVVISYTNSNLLEQDARISNFNAANVDLNNYPYLIGLEDYATIYSAWTGQSDDLNLGFKGFQPQFQLTRIQPAYSTMNGNAAVWVQNLYEPFYLSPLSDTAFRSYAAPLGIALTNTAGYRVEVDILGVDKVKPHEVITFDNTVPLRYQGKHFRPTSLAYDLVGDKVKVTAYQIDSYPIPNPPDPPNPCDPPAPWTPFDSTFLPFNDTFTNNGNAIVDIYFDVIVDGSPIDLLNVNLCEINPENVDIYYASFDLENLGTITENTRFTWFAVDGNDASNFGILQSNYNGVTDLLFTNAPVDIGIQTDNEQRFVLFDQGRPGSDNSAVVSVGYDSSSNRISLAAGRIPPAGAPLHSNANVTMGNLYEIQRLKRSISNGLISNQGAQFYMRRVPPPVVPPPSYPSFPFADPCSNVIPDYPAFNGNGFSQTQWEYGMNIFDSTGVNVSPPIFELVVDSNTVNWATINVCDTLPLDVNQYQVSFFAGNVNSDNTPVGGINQFFEFVFTNGVYEVRSTAIAGSLPAGGKGAGASFSNSSVDVGLEANDGTRYLFRDQGRNFNSNTAVFGITPENLPISSNGDGRIELLRDIALAPVHLNTVVTLHNLYEGKRLYNDYLDGKFSNQGLQFWVRPSEPTLNI